MSATDASRDARARMKTILMLHEQIDEIKLEIRQVYADEKADGGDKTAMGAAVSIIRKREKDRTAFDDREGMKNVYLSAYDGPSGTQFATHVHARDDADAGIERIEKFVAAKGGFAAALSATLGVEVEIVPHDPETGEFTDEPEAAAEVAGDYLREPAAAASGQIIREGDAPRETGRFGGDASCPDTEFQSTAPTVEAVATPQAPQPVATATVSNPQEPTSSPVKADPTGAAAPSPVAAPVDQPAAKPNPHCQKRAAGETCGFAYSQASCWRCTDAAMKAKVA